MPEYNGEVNLVGFNHHEPSIVWRQPASQFKLDNPLGYLSFRRRNKYRINLAPATVIYNRPIEPEGCICLKKLINRIYLGSIKSANDFDSVELLHYNAGLKLEPETNHKMDNSCEKLNSSASDDSSKHVPLPSHHSGNSLQSRLDENTFFSIPPPVGFDSPTRPSMILAALVRGPLSLDETSLSPATQRRLNYVQRHSKSSFQIRSNNSTALAPHGNFIELERERFSKGENWTQFPTSPLSPPSPFQHPFFRRQLGLLPIEPWARFSGFGFPKFNPLFDSVPVKGLSSPQSDMQSRNDLSNNFIHKSKRVSLHHTTKSSMICYSKETQSYQRRISKETRYTSQRYSDGISETESEDDEQIFGTSLLTSESVLFNNNHLKKCGHSEEKGSEADISYMQDGKGSVGIIPLSTSQSQSSMSDAESYSKRNSYSIPFEIEQDDVSSLTTSEADSYHDIISVHSQNDLSRCYSMERDDDPKSAIQDSILSQENAKKDKLHRIALELLHTERSYVKVLHLIDQKFQFKVDQENRVHHIFPGEYIPLIFSNIKSIYKLHHDFLLPQLEERMANWENCSRIGDIMKNFAPFLKMYTEYVRNFDNAMTLINCWQAKSQKFATVMEDIHHIESCGNLTLQHHMLSPVQRIPRYELLLKDYLRRLPEDNPDRIDTEHALHLVSTAANHANDAMKKIDKFERLLAVQECLGGALEIVSPTRELIKESRIIKISARSGDHQERYLFLLSDILLLCAPRLISGRVISGPQYRLRAKYSVESLEVLEGDNLETANTFYIRDNNKTVELYTRTQEEKEAWLEALFHAMNETYRRKSSLRLGLHGEQQRLEELGMKQPILIKMDSVNKCMRCSSHFSVMRRKHHCGACGSVVCNKCSSQKCALAFEHGKSVRVCRACYQTLSELRSATDSLLSETEEKEATNKDSKKNYDGYMKSKGILDISSKAPDSIVQGSLLLKTHRKAWAKRWFSLQQDFVLYSFKSDDQPHALTATPVPGFTVALCHNFKGDSSISEKDKSFRLHHSKKQYIFQASSKEEALRWVQALERASKAELPTPDQ